MASGSIQKRQGARGPAYRVRVEYPPDPVTGDRRQRSETFKIRRAAETALSAWLTEIERGTALEPSKTTVAELLDRWLMDEAPKTTRASTLVGYEITIRKHLKPVLGHCVVQKLTVEQVEHFYAQKRAEGLASSTVKKCHLRLSAALNLAVRWGLSTRNVCQSAKPGKVTYKKPKVWSIEDGEAFLEVANRDGMHPFWMLALESGMRRGELLGLRWSDVNWDRSAVHVQQEVVALRGVPIIQEPKTPESRRTVRLAGHVMAELRRHKVQWAERKLQATEWTDHDLVFCTATSRPINPAHVRRSFDRIVARAGVPDITIHGMRHCHAVWLLRAGTPVKVVSERLGHKDITTTLNVYAAALPDMQDHAIEVLDRLMGRSAQAS
ncbi:MAG TPA: site-specific integrase [Chloroflexota bacterium]|nr:site-specific integrase [Chloroflexota bacterium]